MATKTFHIHIEGIVQGVGFRPFVYRMAKAKRLCGWVNNTSDGVHIQINAEQAEADSFLQSLLNKLPPLAFVSQSSLREVLPETYRSFEIVHSQNNTKPKLLLTPDVAMCEDCKRELHSPDNQRFNYPFITCTNCGTRYSIIKKLPYDRIFTTMSGFQMCDTCQQEYDNPMERRHFSQTNSCPDCPIEMQLYENGKLTENFTDLDYIIKSWQAGKILAIKGIGGYLLTCDATNAAAVSELRKRKQRPTKPFALMYLDSQMANSDTRLSQDEKRELESIYAPIVLLKTRCFDKMENKLQLKLINNGLTRIGVMLSYTPLYNLLLQKFNKPIIATSGNISNSTIIFQDKKAIQELSKIADIILLNNREILIPQDDGVLQFSEKHKQKITLRRSRGKAPIYINPNLKLPADTVFAAGSMLKSVFVLLSRENIYASQYLGNTESYDAQLNYENTFSHLRNILSAEINSVVIDKHPDYFSTRFAKKIAAETNSEIYSLQHHKAHFYSVLGENNLLDSSDKILGVIWDGTGLGDDGNIWGGEFFIYESETIKRVHWLDEFNFILGDKMVKEPKISAIAIASSIENAQKYLKPKFSPTEWKIYQKLLSKNKLKSSSMGRLFDAVSSILLNKDVHSFEAEASMRLENMAAHHYYRSEMNMSLSYLSEKKMPENFTQYIVNEVVADMDRGLNNEQIAAKFHLTLVDYIMRIAEKFKIKKIAFSGGVFQNSLLIDIIIDFMQEKYNLFFQNEFSPNDEGIPFGQLVFFTKNKR